MSAFLINPFRFATSGPPYTDFSDEAFYQASDRDVGDGAGYAVALSGDGNTLAVGAPTDDNSIGADAGSVYIFVRGSGNSWTEEARLQPTSGGAAGQKFGSVVSLSDDGDTLAVGAPGDGTSIQGKAFVFTRSGTSWSQHTDLHSIAGGSPAVADFWGNSVAINSAGDTIAVGAPLRGALDKGAVWCFALSGGVWSEQGSNITYASADSTDYIGSRVALSDDGNTLAASTRNKNALDIFTRSGGVWSHSTRLSAASYTAVSVSSLTCATAISGDGTRALLCTVGEEDGGHIQAGAVHEFVYSGGSWSEGTRFAKAVPAASLQFGLHVAYNNAGDRLCIAHVGSEKTVEIWGRIGASWSRTQTLGLTLGDGDNLGACSFDNDGLILAVGAFGDDTGASGSGAVYTFM